MTSRDSVTRTLLLLMLASGLLHQSFMSSRVTLILYAIRLDTPVWLIGLLQGMYPVAGALFAIPFGRLIDRRGSRGPMQWGALGVGICSLAPALFPGIPVFFATALATGAVANIFYIASLQVMAKLVPAESRVTWLSWNAVTYSVASFTAPLISGFSIDHIGHGWALVIGSVPAFAVAAGIAMGGLPLPGSAGGGGQHGHGGLGDMMRRPQIRGVILVGAIMMVIWDLHGFAVPLYGTQLGLSASTIGMVLSALSIAMLASRAVLPVLTRHVSPVKLMTFALVTSSAGFLLYPFASSLALMLVLTALIGLGCGINHPLSNMLLIEHSPERRSGEAFGLRNMFSHILQVGTPFAMGALSAAAGIAAVFWLTAGTGLAGAVYARRIWPLFGRRHAAKGA